MLIYCNEKMTPVYSLQQIGTDSNARLVERPIYEHQSLLPNKIGTIWSSPGVFSEQVTKNRSLVVIVQLTPDQLRYHGNQTSTLNKL